MKSGVYYLGQAFLYGLFFVPVVLLSSTPVFHVKDADLAVLKLSIRHAGELVGACKESDADAYRNLPANMQQLQVCPRERSPLMLQLKLDGTTIYDGVIAPSGFQSDGISSMYAEFDVQAGMRHLELSMNDDASVADFNWKFTQDVELKPRQVRVVTFKEGFQLH